MGGAPGTCTQRRRRNTNSRAALTWHQSIYPDYLSANSLSGAIKLEVPVELSEPRFVVPLADDRARTEGPSQAPPAGPPLSALPPLLLELLLPPAYPLHAAPEIVALHATHGWLGRMLGPLRQHLLEMWQGGEGVLYAWIESIRSGEFLASLQLLDTVEGKDVVRCAHIDI